MRAWRSYESYSTNHKLTPDLDVLSIFLYTFGVIPFDPVYMTILGSLRSKQHHFLSKDIAPNMVVKLKSSLQHFFWGSRHKKCNLWGFSYRRAVCPTRSTVIYSKAAYEAVSVKPHENRKKYLSWSQKSRLGKVQRSAKKACKRNVRCLECYENI